MLFVTYEHCQGFFNIQTVSQHTRDYTMLVTNLIYRNLVHEHFSFSIHRIMSELDKYLKIGCSYKTIFIPRELHVTSESGKESSLELAFAYF